MKDNVKVIVFILAIILILYFRNGKNVDMNYKENIENSEANTNQELNETFNLQSTVEQVKNDSSFKDFGNLIFPLDINIPNNTILENVGSYYYWYNYINPNKTLVQTHAGWQGHCLEDMEKLCNGSKIISKK